MNIPYKWRILFTCSTVEFANAATAMVVLAVFIDPMTLTLNWSRTSISGAVAIGSVIGACMAPVTGQINDRYGPRGMLIISTVLVSVSCIVLSYVQTSVILGVALIVFRICDQGATKVLTASSVGKAFSENRGFAVSMVFLAGSLGCVIVAPGAQFIITIFSWREAWLCLGCLMFLGGTIPTIILLKSRNKNGLNNLSTGTDLTKPSAAFNRQELITAFKSVSFVYILISLFLTGMASSGVILHLMSYLVSAGFSESVSVSVLSVIAISSAVGSILWGKLADRFNVKWVCVATYVTLVLAIGIVIFPYNITFLYLMGLALGLAGVGVNTLSALLLANYYGTNILASIYGLSRTAQVMGFALGILFSGVVYDRTGAYQTAFSILLLLSVIGLLALLLAKKPKVF
ncbi:MAG TPA: hypothetical protein DEZ08_00320 [Dehalococcoidia bacterium]|nr:hypothetical protein [Dehalococcoidia bacterium]